MISDKLTVGFQADKFKMFNNGQVIFESICGGGHRSCDFWIEENLASLCYIKKGQVILEKAKLAEKTTTSGSGHTGHINHAVTTDYGVATCGEDTKIVLHKKDKKLTLDVHDTSLRCLTYQNGLLAAGGGKEIISLHNLKDESLLGIYDPNRVKYNSEKKSVQNKKRKRNDNVTSDSRVMSLCFLPDQKLCSLTSNGKAQLFSVSSTGLEILSSTMVSENHCPTKMYFYKDRLYIVDTGKDDTFIFVTLRPTL